MPTSLIQQYVHWLEVSLEATEAGRLSEAQRAADELVDVAASLTPMHRAQAITVAAGVAARQGRLTTAIRQFRTAIDELDGIGDEDPFDDGGASLRLMKATGHVLLGEALYANHEANHGAESYRSAFSEVATVASSCPGRASEALRQVVGWRIEMLGKEIAAAREGLVDVVESQRTWTTLVQQACIDVTRLASMGERVEDLRATVAKSASVVGLELYSQKNLELVLETVQPVLGHARALADTSEDQEALSRLTGLLLLLAEALIGLGRSDEAIPHLERALEVARSVDGRGSFESEMVAMGFAIEEQLSIARDGARSGSARGEPHAERAQPPKAHASPASEAPSGNDVGMASDDGGGSQDGHARMHALLDDPTNIAGYAAQGGDPNVAQRDGTPLLVAAAASVEPEVTELLLRNDADVAARDRRRRTALHLAATRDDDRIARTLLEHGADPTAKDEDGWTPATYAAAWGSQPDIVRLLADHGADLTGATNGPLVGAAAFQSRPGMIAAFSAHGADADTRLPAPNGGDAPTALMIAALRNERPDVVRALIDAGADVSATTGDGLTAAHFAAARTDGRHIEVLSILADAGADLGTTSHDGMNVDAVVQAYQASHAKRATS